MMIAPKQARIQLDRQIDQLAELRNAGTRAIEFREWRQTTLTLIERIWPDQPSRAIRFRRIPFSPTSAKADDRLTREAFERGCAEARRLLRLWLAEISTRGVTQDADAPRLAEAVRATLVEMQPKPPVRPPAARQAPQSPPEPPGRGPARPGEKRTKKQLGHMIGRPTGRGRPALPQEFEMTGGPATDPVADALALSIDHALERARRETRGMRPAGEPIDSKGRSHEPVQGGMQNRVLVSYVARAFIGMAGDIEELGVPEGHRERVRLALLDLAHHLDCGSVTWGLMRDAITLVMHYPALGRQAVPLLLPYLENAA